MSRAASPRGLGSVRPKAIIFDWDNTLVDTWPAIHDALAATFVAFGLEPWTFDDTRRRVRRSMRDSFPELFGARWEEAGKVFYARFAAVHLEKLAPRPCADEALASLHHAGIYLGVVSNKLGDYLRAEARHLGWEPYFGRLVGAFDASRDKPACEPVDLVLGASGIERGSEVWFVGDTDIDLECAVNAGCVPILIREDAPAPGEFAIHPPVWHVEDCLALCNLIERL